MKYYPFSIFILAPFPGTLRTQDSTPLLGPFDIYDVDEALTSLNSCINVSLPRRICPAGETQIKIRSIADLKPKKLVRGSTFLSNLVDALDFVKKHRTDPESMRVGLQRQFNHLPLDLSVLAPAPEPAPKPEGGSILDSLFSKVAIPDDSSTAPQPDVQIEEMLRETLTCVYRDADFRRLESIVRGLQMLVRQGPVKKSAKTSVTLCNADTHNLESALRHIVRSSAEHSPSLVLVDMPFDNSFVSVDMLETLSNFSEAIQVPTVVELSAAFFGKTNWAELSSVGYLSRELESAAYAKFCALQNAPSTRWLTLALPEICFRNPYGTDGVVGPVPFKESEEVWVSPVWAVGTLAVRSQMALGWPCRLTDPHVCQVDQMVIPKNKGETTPLRTSFNEDRFEQLKEVGMTPLRALVGQEQIFMTQAPSMNKQTLGFQLFTNRIIGFFHHQQTVLAAQPTKMENPSDLVTHLQTVFLAKWDETQQPRPDDFGIDVAHILDMGKVVLSVRVKPPLAIVPEPRLLEFEISFEI